MEYCKRSIEKVHDDIVVYAGWSSDHESNGIYVEGIFLDEAPNEYTDGVGKYLNSVSEKIKAASGILGEKLVSLDEYVGSVCELTKTRSFTTQAQFPTKN